MKKLGVFVIIVLLLLVLKYSGILDDERVIYGIENGFKTAVRFLEQGVQFVIGKLK